VVFHRLDGARTMAELHVGLAELHAGERARSSGRRTRSSMEAGGRAAVRGGGRRAGVQPHAVRRAALTSGALLRRLGAWLRQEGAGGGRGGGRWKARAWRWVVGRAAGGRAGGAFTGVGEDGRKEKRIFLRICCYAGCVAGSVLRDCFQPANS
jgi:hypothetical protein